MLKRSVSRMLPSPGVLTAHGWLLKWCKSPVHHLKCPLSSRYNVPASVCSFLRPSQPRTVCNIMQLNITLHWPVVLLGKTEARTGLSHLTESNQWLEESDDEWALADLSTSQWTAVGLAPPTSYCTTAEELIKTQPRSDFSVVSAQVEPSLKRFWMLLGVIDLVPSSCTDGTGVFGPCREQKHKC